ncbi:hypothetical protein ACH51_01815 [Ralstonia solanacearum]|nr:hypothetical protein ACH51_01815 [Ralstonia solanacearum]
MQFSQQQLFAATDYNNNIQSVVVFLLVQDALFRLGDVSAILGRHVALFLADPAIFPVQLGGLRLGHLAFLHFWPVGNCATRSLCDKPLGQCKPTHRSARPRSGSFNRARLLYGVAGVG